MRGETLGGDGVFVPGETRATEVLEGENTLVLPIEGSWFLCAATSPHPIFGNLGGLVCPDVR